MESRFQKRINEIMEKKNGMPEYENPPPPPIKHEFNKEDAKELLIKGKELMIEKEYDYIIQKIKNLASEGVNNLPVSFSIHELNLVRLRKNEFKVERTNFDNVFINTMYIISWDD